MKFFRRSAGNPCHLGIFAGTFNPVTVAHISLAEAALGTVGEVVFVLPRVFPHKSYQGASFAQRVQLLDSALGSYSQFSLAECEGGLFVEIAAECREAYGAEVRQSFLCGRDAAERIATWDYGQPGAFKKMLHDFDLLVAARQGEYLPPPGLANSFVRLELKGDFDHVSSSEVRDRIAKGEEWEHLVPASVRGLVREIYSSVKKV